ncbi:DUF3772 domain-containing protein [Tropicimonas sediminicola]|uniref:Small-conductance mechanosensitive channel n=1 Tax=Tropicimonas sediminicola TaxID=1031541 RepID=A0A239E7X5_9RHOB|nr:DUF3772 domain-containing protein [Tropicimonas sediminicola]SNS40388.1 Small-conductance mechanosensitive channel [Tropicimonas sediminicola]
MRRLLAALLVLVATAALLPAQWGNGAGGAGLFSGATWAQEAAQGTVAASDANAPLDDADYRAWEEQATEAEEMLDSGNASISELESLRRTLNDWRSRFNAEQQRDADRIGTLESQIDALGPPPEEGTTEAEDVAARRTALNDEYQARIAPVVRAEEGYALAQSLIGRFDRLIRERQKQRLLERNPAPIMPSSLRAALEDAVVIVSTLSGEVREAISQDSHRQEFRDNLPSIVLMLALALLLLVSGRGWMGRTVRRMVKNRPGGDKRFVAAMILSINQFLLPLIGLAVLAAALKLTAAFGPVGESVIDSMAGGGIAFAFARWLGGQTFPKDDNWPTSLTLSSRERVRGRFYSSSLGVLMGLSVVVTQLVDLFPLGSATISAYAFPIIVATAICVGGLARLLVASGKRVDKADEADAEAAERRFFDNLVGAIGRFVGLLAFIGPVLAMIGYTRAGIALTLSPGLTLGLLALIAYLQRLSSGIIGLFSEPGQARDGLLPVIINFLIVIAALPLFALIWGARVADLAEIWTHLRDGFTIGGTQISPSLLVVLVTAFGAGFLLTRLVQGALSSSVLPRTSLDPGAQKAMISGLGYVGIALSAMVAVSVAGLDLSNLAIVAGALSVGVGFGLQNIVQNFVSGLILLIERPVTEGDWVEVGGVMGTVRKISVRATTIETFDRTDVVVPNSDFVTGQVTNWTRGNLTGRLILTVGVAYGSDTRKVAEILQEIAEAHPLVIVNPPPMVVFQGFGADSLDFEMRVILRDINFGLGTRSELNHQIAERFAAEGIEIPFAQRDIWLRNPEALRGGAPTPAQAPLPDTGTDTRSASTPGPIRPDSDPEFPSEDVR